MSETVSMDKINFGFGISLAIIAIVNALLTLGKELFPAVKDMSAAVGSLIGVDHHWMGHGIIILLLFVILGFIFSQATISNYFIEKFAFDQLRLLILIGICVIIGIGLIGGYFFMHTFLG
ncbi:MAG: hypothetical protein ACXACU_06380 [Candidatus Hodarchaeales archaeon]|jgi:hypothetical protein